MTRGPRAGTCMLGSAACWAVVPVLFGLGARPGVDAVAFTAAANAAGGAVCLLLFLVVGAATRDWCHGEVARHLLGTGRGRALTLLDGGGLATSNVAFVLAMSFGSSAVATVIVESWPVLATAAMAVALARFRPLVPRQVPWMLVCLGGFVLLVASSGSGGLSVAPLAVVLAVVAALAQAVAVTANQKVLEDLPRASPSATLLTQAVRMLVGAAVCAAGAAVAHPSSTYDGVPAAGAVLLGCTIGVSALLFTLSLRRSPSPTVTLLWFLTPAMSVLLLAAVGQAELTAGVVVGTGLVLAASLVLVRGSEPAPV